MPTLSDTRFIIGILGNIASTCIGLSPLPTFVRIWRHKSTESFSPIPYASALFCSLLWAWYAMPFVSERNLLVLTINGSQTVLRSVYLVIFFVFAPAKGKIKVLQLVFLIIITFALDVIVTMVVTYKRRPLCAGIIATGSAFILFASPLSIMKLVIRTKSSEFMPIYFILSLLISSFIWAAFGILGRDLFVIVSNAPGIFLGIIQLVIYLMYCNKWSHKRPEEEIKEDEIYATENKLSIDMASGADTLNLEKGLDAKELILETVIDAGKLITGTKTNLQEVTEKSIEANLQKVTPDTISDAEKLITDTTGYEEAPTSMTRKVS